MTKNLSREFQSVKRPGRVVLNGVCAVIVLCAEEVEITGENKERIDAALGIINSLDNTPPLIFMGTKAHIIALEAYLCVKKDDVKVLYPTRRKHESSWTQIKSLAQYLCQKKFKKVLIVSHAYHIPRLRRYCSKYINKEQQYKFYPVGNIKNQSRRVKEEIVKIIKYAKKGDLPLEVMG